MIRAGSTTLILDHVVVTHSAARIYLRRATPGLILEAAALNLFGAGKTLGGGEPLFWWTWNTPKVVPASRLYGFDLALSR